MQSQFSPPLTRLDAVLWFLRVQLWLSVVNALTALVQPSIFFWSLAAQNLLPSALAVLIFALFPRVLASAMLGSGAGAEVASLHDLRPLVGRCVGAAFFVHSLGNAVLYSGYIGYSLLTHSSLFAPGMPSSILITRVAGTAISFFLGFALAFGPAIRDGLRSH